MNKNEQTIGIVVATFSYLIWGFIPLYWKLLTHVSPGEILAHRIIWSFILMLAILLMIGKLKQLPTELKALLQNRKRIIGISIASFIISLNWVIYIWAVNTNHVVESSLGYYINPLVSIILGMIVLKEKLSGWQFVSFLLAGIGVLNITISFGAFPWISISLAISFGIYGLLKKIVQIGPLFGLTIETMIITPFALLYLSFVQLDTGIAFGMDWKTTLLLIGAGVVTATPLLLFANGASRIPLSMMGFLQYIAPTIMLFLGVFIYHEPFTQDHLISFTCIWSALTIYSLSKTKWFLFVESKITHMKKSLQG